MEKTILLQGLHQDWLDILDNSYLDDALQKIDVFLEDAQLDISYITPKPCDLFMPFRFFLPSETTVVILGEAAYPNINATGLAFDQPIKTKPSLSLTRIYDCLYNYDICQKQSHNTLKTWASQGVLLLNLQLTNIIGGNKEHGGIWDDFIVHILKHIGVSLVCWGVDIEYSGQKIMWKYSPSQQSYLHFKHCDTFAKLNGCNICFDPQLPLLIFTDGSCPNNSLVKKQPELVRAGWGVYIQVGEIYSVGLSGEVDRVNYKLSGKEIIACNISDDVTPTNNRGELLAVCQGLLWGITHYSADITLISDSMYCLNMVNEATTPKTNFDLINIIASLMRYIRKKCIFNSTHIKSHQKEPKDKLSMEHNLWFGNDRADTLCLIKSD